MSGLHEKLEEYLAVRRTMGFKMSRQENCSASSPGSSRKTERRL
jgi:hypothetical protein